MSRVVVRTAAQCLADADHRLIACDDAYLELLGRERREVIGRRILDLTYAPDRPANALMLKGLASEGRAFSITKRYVRGDGDLIWVTNGVGSVPTGLAATGSLRRAGWRIGRSPAMR
jgi:PAS domain S-box-containing protein